MNCDESLPLLSDYQANALDETMSLRLRQHLTGCPPCDAVYRELEVIVMTARVLRAQDDGITFPDENVLWQRMALTKRGALH